MNPSAEVGRIPLGTGAKVVVVGGGPAGAFFAIHLLRRARPLGRAVQVTIIERRRTAGGSAPPCPADCWKGCNYCAGGLSPKLLDVLNELDLRVPDEVVQSRIESITIQGYWKNIELDVPAGREMLSVYRGTRPLRREDREHNFDSFLLQEAIKAGAELISGEVRDVQYGEDGKPRVLFQTGTIQSTLSADLAVFAAGVNEGSGSAGENQPLVQALRRLLPAFVPPRLRRAFIFEMEGDPGIPASLNGTIHFVEYGSRRLRLEMCSIVPKRGFITVVLVGPSVDALESRGQNREIMDQFLNLPHIRKLVPPPVRLHSACMCAPNMVIGSARNPFGNRVAAIGDIVTTRLYKDGILSAHQTAEALADAVLRHGVDAGSLQRGYGPILDRFRRDNRFASMVFLLHRIFFGSSVLSRILYQAVITERKTTEVARRHWEGILWRIASGDDQYEEIFRAMIRPATLWQMVGATVVTLRNYVTELLFGLRWEGFGRFTTGVARERFEAKHREFSRLIAESRVAVPEKLEFERMYTIKIRAPRQPVLEQLGRFGENDRGYLRPRGIRIERVAGVPNQPGCTIRYTILSRRLWFALALEQIVGEHLVVYRVQNGFARGGVLIFEIEKVTEETSTLSIYVAFNFPRGLRWTEKPFWWLFRLLFPAFIHDVVWNHSLCQFKDVVESESGAELAPGSTVSSQDGEQSAPASSTRGDAASGGNAQTVGRLTAG